MSYQKFYEKCIFHQKT